LKDFLHERRNEMTPLAVPMERRTGLRREAPWANTERPYAESIFTAV
jgi:hypothetical protein